MIDLHCHILPGIDDGPNKLEESLELAKLAVANGITHCVVTPHIHPGRYSNTADSIRTACSQFKDSLQKEAIPLKIGFAGEVRLSDDIIGLLSQQQIPFYGEYKGYKIILLELPHNRIPAGCENLLQWLLSKKIRPMIAHPERNKEIMRDHSKIRMFIQNECLLQLTAGSIVGSFGKEAQQCATHLLQMGFVTVIASDAHNVNKRPPRLDHGRDAVATLLGEEEANKMVYDRPMAIAGSLFT